MEIREYDVDETENGNQRSEEKTKQQFKPAFHVLQDGQFAVEVLHAVHLAIGMSDKLLLAVLEAHLNDSQWVVNALASFVSVASYGSFYFLGRPAQVQNVDRELHTLLRQLGVLLLELLVRFGQPAQRLSQFETLNHRILASQRQVRRTGKRPVRVESRAFQHKWVVVALNFALNAPADFQMRNIHCVTPIEKQLHNFVVVVMSGQNEWRDVGRELRSTN